MMTTRNDCLARDADDPLADLRAQFDLPPGVIYLDGNSLGARPRTALARASAVIADEWGRDLIRSWNSAGWFELPRRLGARLAPLLGAGVDEVVITDTTSVNLFKALAAALQLQAEDAGKADRRIIVSERANFPTDLYMVEGLTTWLDRGYQLRLIDSPEQLPDAIDGDTAVVLLTHVNYRSGYQYDMQATSSLAHAHGALIVWDLAHSAGAVPVDLNGDGADLAVGCTYKYLNGGPGAPAFIWVPRRHQANFRQPLSGWWSHAAPFAMAPAFAPADGIARALCGTQPIVSLALTDLFIALVEQRCANHPLGLVTPREHARRGSHVSFTHPHGYAVMQALIARGVIGDYREPAIMRFGFTPLYTGFADVWDAVEILRDILERADYDVDARRDAVT